MRAASLQLCLYLLQVLQELCRLIQVQVAIVMVELLLHFLCQTQDNGTLAQVTRQSGEHCVPALAVCTVTSPLSLCTLRTTPKR